MMAETTKKVTMSDIADSLGISKNSVSLALNNKEGVSDELRKRIIDTARRMNYGVFTTQAEARGKCILIMVPEYLFGDSFFYTEVFWAIENEISNMGYISINAGVTVDMEKSLTLPTLPTEMEALGVLVIGVLRDSYITALKQLNLPILSVDISYNTLDVSWVGSANITGGCMATQHLVDNGHKKIGFIGSIFFAESIFERYCGFMRVMMSSGIEIDPRFNIIGSPENPTLFDTASALEGYFESVTEYPDAWFCAGDRTAVALINILNRRNVRVPEDVSVIGFDDIPITQSILPALTTIRIDRKRMGSLAVSTLLNLKGGTMGIQIPVELVERSSVARKF